MHERRPGHVAMLLENHPELLALYAGCGYAGLTLFGVNTGLRGETLEFIGAGMPPALIYRAADHRVETVPLKGMPLGSLMDFPYHTTQIDLAPGDTVMLMSDGFPELFNSQQKMFGYDRAGTVFEEIAHRSPEEIIEHFVKTAAMWRNDPAPTDEPVYKDDITFIVMKVKGSPHA